MSDTSQGEGWWIASDGKWYPPHLHPNYVPPVQPVPPVPVPPVPVPPVGVPPVAVPQAAQPAPVYAPPDKRRGRIVAIAAVAAVAVGGGTYLGSSYLSGSDGSSSGAESAEAAADQFFTSMDNEDPIGLLEIMDPNELGGAVELGAQLRETIVTMGRNEDGSGRLDLDLSVTGPDGRPISYRVVPLGGRDDLARVEIDAVEMRLTSEDGGQAAFVIGDDGVDVVPTNELNGLEVDLQRIGGTTRLTAVAPDVGTGEVDDDESTGEGDIPMDLIVVEREGRWYVSPSYTIAEVLRAAFDVNDTPDFGAGQRLLEAGTGGGADPTEAVTNMADDIAALDIEAAVNGIDPISSGVAHDYLPLLVDEIDEEARQETLADRGPAIDQLDVTPSADGLVTIDQLEFSFDTEYDGRRRVTVDDNWCLAATDDYDTDSICIREEIDAALADNGVTDISAADLLPTAPFVAVSEREGRYFVDPVRTLRLYLEQFSDAAEATDLEQLPLPDQQSIFFGDLGAIGTARTISGVTEWQGLAFEPSADAYTVVEGEFGDEHVYAALVEVSSTGPADLRISGDGYDAEREGVTGARTVLVASDGDFRTFGVAARAADGGAPVDVTVTVTPLTVTTGTGEGGQSVTIGPNGEPVLVVYDSEVVPDAGLVLTADGNLQQISAYDGFETADLVDGTETAEIPYDGSLIVSGEPGRTVTITGEVPRPVAPVVENVDPVLADELYALAIDNGLDQTFNFADPLWGGCGDVASDPTVGTVGWFAFGGDQIALVTFPTEAAAADYLASLPSLGGTRCDGQSDDFWSFGKDPEISGQQVTLSYSYEAADAEPLETYTEVSIQVGANVVNAGSYDPARAQQLAGELAEAFAN